MKEINAFINTIIHGDCTRVLKEIPSGSVDLIVTDPPYGVNYQSRDGRRVPNDDNLGWLEPASKQMYRVLKSGSFCISFYGWNKVEHFMRAWTQAGFRPVGHIVCTKDYASNQGFTRFYHEMAYLLAKGEPPKPASPPRDVLAWRYTGNKLHPTQKPIEVLVPLITAYSKRRDIVLDPFAGSGTTAVVAHKLGRRYIGIELSEDYCRAAQSRLPGSNHYKHNHTTTMAYTKGYIETTVEEFTALLDKTKLADKAKDELITFVDGKLRGAYRLGKENGIKQSKRRAA